MGNSGKPSKGTGMSNWQQSFATKVEALREKCTRTFDNVAAEVVEPTFTKFEEFVSTCDFNVTRPQSQHGLRSFKFALAEDAYVLFQFRPRGVAEVECEYEIFVPSQGRIEAKRLRASFSGADRDWVRGCFESGLDSFVSLYGEVTEWLGNRDHARPPAHAHA
jgi:hypothetical protein